MKKADVLSPQTANKMNSFRRKGTRGKNGKETVVRMIQTAGWGNGGVEACLRRGLIFRSAVCLGRRWKAPLFLSVQEGHRAPLYRRDRGRQRQRGGQAGLNNSVQLLVDLSLRSWSIPVGRLLIRSHLGPQFQVRTVGLQWGFLSTFFSSFSSSSLELLTLKYKPAVCFSTQSDPTVSRRWVLEILAVAAVFPLQEHDSFTLLLKNQ